MDCTKARQLTDLYIDEALSAEQANEFEQHISSCADCKQYYEHAMRFKTALSLLGDKQPPEGLALSAIKKAQKRRPVFAYVSTATAVAAAALILVVSLSAGGLGGADSAVPREPMMFTQDMPAEDHAISMESFGAPNNEITADVADPRLPEDGLAQKGAGIGVYSSEEEFAAAYAGAYYKPSLLPEGAVLTNISVSETSVVFAYTLDDSGEFVFEWLKYVPPGGLEAEINALYGGGYVQDRDCFVLSEAEYLQVFWEQSGQAFRIRIPEGLDYKSFSEAAQVNPYN